MKNTIKLLSLIGFFLISASLYAQTPETIVGTWLTGSGKAKVKIEKKNNKYYGRIVWLKTPTYEDGSPKVDKNNPDASKRVNPVLGLNLLKDFVFDEGDKEWNNGTIYDPENGKTYSCNITLAGDKKIHVRGYVGISLIGRTDTWFKVMDIKE